MQDAIDLDEVHKFDVGLVARESSFLGCDHDDPAATCEVAEMLADQVHRSSATHVLEHVCEQQRVEARGLRVRGGAELLGLEYVESGPAGEVDGECIVIYPDGVFAEVAKVAADPASHLECAAEGEAPQVPAVRCLNIEPAAPAAACRALEPRGIRGSIRRQLLPLSTALRCHRGPFAFPRLRHGQSSSARKAALWR